MRSLLLLLLAALAGFACALGGQKEAVPAIEPVKVRVGEIAPNAYDAVTSAPEQTVARIERLVDLFFQAGCAGEDLTQPRLSGASYPDVVCRLPGQGNESVVVAAYLGPPEKSHDDWSGAVLLPQLYRALGVEKRQHSYIFVGLTENPSRGMRSGAARLEDAGEVSALVDLQYLRANGSSELLFMSPDASLRQDLGAVGAALGVPRESLRWVSEDYSRNRMPTIVRMISVPEEGPRAQVPMITIASPLPRKDARRRGAPVPDERMAFQTAGRTIAVYLAYLDDSLRLRQETPAVAAPAEPTPTEPPEPL